MKRIGVRELRQNASKHLQLVQNGETIEITDRGRPIALLVPVPSESSPVDTLERQGRLGPEVEDVLELGAPLAPVADRARPSEVIKQMRDDAR
jgi:prevent-host-death family protein